MRIDGAIRVRSNVKDSLVGSKGPHSSSLLENPYISYQCMDIYFLSTCLGSASMERPLCFRTQLKSMSLEGSIHNTKQWMLGKGTTTTCYNQETYFIQKLAVLIKKSTTNLSPSSEPPWFCIYATPTKLIMVLKEMGNIVNWSDRYLISHSFLFWKPQIPRYKKEYNT